MIGENNPFNIRAGKSQWVGLCSYPSTRGFANFLSVDYAIRACAILLMQTYRKLGIRTISGIVHRFAPASDGNNEKAYIDYLSSNTLISPTALLQSSSSYAKVIKYMAWFESNFLISDSCVLDVIKQYNIKLYERE